MVISGILATSASAEQYGTSSYRELLSGSSSESAPTTRCAGSSPEQQKKQAKQQQAGLEPMQQCRQVMVLLHNEQHHVTFHIEQTHLLYTACETLHGANCYIRNAT